MENNQPPLDLISRFPAPSLQIGKDIEQVSLALCQRQRAAFLDGINLGFFISIPLTQS